MGCDFWIHRVGTGIFNYSVRKSRRRYNKSNTLNTLVTSISLTEPSRVHINANSDFITIGAKIDHSANSTAWQKNILIDDLITIQSLENGSHFQWSIFTVNVPDFDHTTKTTTSSFISGKLIGNKGAHSYFGNTQKAKRTPKYPCIVCEKAVMTRSRAVSCDTCDNWTHSKCTGSISNEQYDKLVKK